MNRKLNQRRRSPSSGARYDVSPKGTVSESDGHDLGRKKQEFDVPRRVAPFSEPFAPGIGERAAQAAQYNRAVQDPRMTIGFFVETKFIPEHVQYKTPAGQTHFQAMMKHILKPENVDRMFKTQRVSKARLTSVPDWPYLDDVRLCDFHSDHVRRIISFAAGREYSWQTLKHIKNVLGAIISHAQEEGCFSSRNPVSDVRLAPRHQGPEQNLTISQTRTILEFLRSPEREIALMTICTGMSVLEACKLQWRHVNLTDSPRCESGELIPPKSIAIGAHLRLAGIKDYARGRRRDVEISGPLLSLLQTVRAGSKYSLPNDYVVTTSVGIAIVPAHIRASLKRVGQKLGIPWLSWHALKRVGNIARSLSGKDLTEQLGIDAPSATDTAEVYSQMESAGIRDSFGRTEISSQSFCGGMRFR